MGLDNIPHRYPCRDAGTAVLVAKTYSTPDGDETVDQIDCDATQAAGGCPWLNANPPTEGRVYGIMGAQCWYRGKYGNYLLENFGAIDGNDFYGDNEDGTYKSPTSCLSLADEIDGMLVSYEGETLTDEQQETRTGLIYAAWYLRWAAATTDGLDCWY